MGSATPTSYNAKALLTAILVLGGWYFLTYSSETALIGTNDKTQVRQLTLLEAKLQPAANSSIAKLPLTYFEGPNWESELVFVPGKLSCQHDDDAPAGNDEPIRPGIRMARRPIILASEQCPRAQDMDAGMCVMTRGTGEMACLPSLVVIGAMKAGTAEIQGWLAQHPNMYRWGGPSDSGAGEAHLFDKVHSDEELSERWFKDYALKGFVLPRGPEDARRLYTFEKTPRYMILEEDQVQRMKRLLPSVRLLAILRNPVSRAYSHFQHRCRQGRIFITSSDLPAPFGSRVLTGNNGSLAISAAFPNHTSPIAPDQIFRMAYPCAPETFDALLLEKENGEYRSNISTTVVDGGLLRRGQYHFQIRRYLRYFKREQLQILLTEEMFGDFVGAIDSVQSFLQLPYHNYSSRTYVNERGFTVLEGLGSKANQNPYEPMTAHMKEVLTEYYRPASAQLARYVEPERLQRYWHEVADSLDRDIDDRDDDDDRNDEGDDDDERRSPDEQETE